MVGGDDGYLGSGVWGAPPLRAVFAVVVAIAMGIAVVLFEKAFPPVIRLDR